jgi:protein phosphatase
VTNPTPARNSGANRRKAEIIVHVFGRTDVGRTREHNEDAFVVADLSTENATLQPEVRTHVSGPKGSFFMVADGMGGAAAGEIASAMAVDIILGELRTAWVQTDELDAEAFVLALKQATKTANEQINTYAAAHPEYRGMGTTATIAGLLGDTLYLAQVGDSRAYIVRNGLAQQITKDQSLMQKLIEAGELTEEEAANSERRNIILQALGPEATVKVDLTHQAVRDGDILVLCSDGLSGQVTKEDIAAIVRDEPDLTLACKRLIDAANERGGPDNITVIVARFEGTGLRKALDDDHIGHRVYPLPDTGQTPAVPFERVSREATTQPIVVESRPSRSARPSAERAADVPMEPTPVPEAAPVATLPDVSPRRRSIGQIIAVALLTILVIGAVWFVVRGTRDVTSGTATSPPTSRP